MESGAEFVKLVHSVVLEPNITTALYLLLTSAVNEIFSIIPYGVILSGQLVFLKGAMTLGLFMKLLVLVSLPVGIGTTLGSLVIYTIAYVGGKPAIQKLGKYLRISWSDVEKFESRLKGSWYDEIIFLLIRSIPLLPALPVNIAAGIVRMPPFSYLVLTIIGSTLRMMIMFMVVALGVGSLVP